MITNSSLTLYHKIVGENHTETFKRIEINNAWVYKNEGSIQSNGLQRNYNVQIRIPYYNNDRIDIKNFSIGDVICIGIDNKIIKKTTEKNDDNYTIVSITNNLVGNEPHIRIGAN